MCVSDPAHLLCVCVSARACACACLRVRVCVCVCVCVCVPYCSFLPRERKIKIKIKKRGAFTAGSLSSPGSSAKETLTHVSHVCKRDLHTCQTRREVSV